METFPESICPIEVLKTIGENIILADSNYKIVWFNPNANHLLTKVGPLFDLPNADSFIGISMDHFHANPAYQRAIMSNLDGIHRTRINIKNTYVTDIVINPVKDQNKDIKGYVVMLMDVTTKAQEEKRKDKLIRDLSVPLLHLWDHTMAVPLIGVLNEDRFDIILTTILEECQRNQTRYMVIDLSGLTAWRESLNHQLAKIIYCLRIMGTECLLTGIKYELAEHLSSEIISDIPLFFSTKEAIQYISSVKKIPL